MKRLLGVALALGAVVGCTGDPTPDPAPAPAAAPPAPAGRELPRADELDAARSEPVDDPYYPEQGEPYLDVLHYDLVLDWAVGQRVLTGTATLTFEVTEERDTIRLDLAGRLEVDAVELDGEPVTSQARGDDLLVATGDLAAREPYRLEITYAGTPEPTGYPGSRGDITGLGWTTEPDGSVWTLQEPFGAFTWYPVNDHPSDKALYDATITTDGGFTNVFNGALVDSSTESGTTTSRWRLDEPAASYLITIAIGDYTATEDVTDAGVPLTYWTETPRLPPHLDESPEMLAWLSELLGPYPYETAGAVVVPADSAMETQTMATLGDSVLRSGSYGRTVVLHEYAHQWLGNAVTPARWDELWLNEGLTMYVQLLWEEHVGLADLPSTIRTWERRDTADRRLYGPPGAFEPAEFASVNVYLSGAVLLHRIREAAGDEAFFAALRTWVAEHQDGNVTRDDFVTSWSASTGLALDAYVEEWLTADETPTGQPG